LCEENKAQIVAPADFSVVSVPTGLSLPARAPSVWMGFAQPHLSVDDTDHGFQLTPACRERQAHLVEDCVKLVSEEAKSGRAAMHILAMPEFSLPLAIYDRMVDLVKQPEWPANSVFVSGVESVEISGFRKILEASSNPIEAKSLRSDSSSFVNFCATWTKNSNGQVQTYVQPKLKPSAPEQAKQGMYRGDFVLLFQSSRFSFIPLICFDVIGEFAQTSASDQVLQAVGKLATAGMSVRLDVIFVLQHNVNPEHPTFLDFANAVLHGGQDVRTTDSGVAFVNSAHATHGRAKTPNFGRSALYYTKGTWEAIDHRGEKARVPETFALEHPYPHAQFAKLIRARFREDGPCIHSFFYFIPSLVGESAGAVRYPLDIARCHKLSADGHLEDGHQIPAFCKIVPDWVLEDSAHSDNRLQCNVAIKNIVDAALSAIRTQIRGLGLQRTEQIVDLLLLGHDRKYEKPDRNPDTWQEDPVHWYSHTKGQALLELASALLVLSLLEIPDLKTLAETVSGSCGRILVTILDGADQFGADELLKEYREFIQARAWMELIGRVNLVLMTRLQRGHPRNDLAEEVFLRFSKPTGEDRVAIPADLPRSTDTFLKEGLNCYWHVLPSLRGALNSESLETARSFLEGKLGSVFPAR